MDLMDNATPAPPLTPEQAWAIPIDEDFKTSFESWLRNGGYRAALQDAVDNDPEIAN